jgi:hypothetical protein
MATIKHDFGVKRTKKSVLCDCGSLVACPFHFSNTSSRLLLKKCRRLIIIIIISSLCYSLCVFQDLFRLSRFLYLIRIVLALTRGYSAITTLTPFHFILPPSDAKEWTALSPSRLSGFAGNGRCQSLVAKQKLPLLLSRLSLALSRQLTTSHNPENTHTHTPIRLQPRILSHTLLALHAHQDAGCHSNAQPLGGPTHGARPRPTHQWLRPAAPKGPCDRAVPPATLRARPAPSSLPSGAGGPEHQRE